MPVEAHIVQEAARAAAHEALGGSAQHPTLISGIAWIALAAVVTTFTLGGLSWLKERLNLSRSPVGDLRGKTWKGQSAKFDIPWSGVPTAQFGTDAFIVTNLRLTIFGKLQGELVCCSHKRTVGVVVASLSANKCLNLAVLFTDGREPEYINASGLGLVE